MENAADIDDDPYSSEDFDGDEDDSDSEFEACIPKDELDVVYVETSSSRYGMRERPVYVH
jgi:hypothetical protein